MPEHQADLPLDDFALDYSPAPAAPPELRAEIAAVWGLPLGERVEVDLRDGSVDALTGTLELAASPDFPWNPREPLQLRIAGIVFSSRDLARWTRR